MNAPSIGFAVAPLTPAIGGLVAGLDLAEPLSESVVARLKAAVAERHVLFFEGQTLDPDTQRDFAAQFGTLHVHPVYPHVDGVPEITSIETRPDDLPDNDNWHTDVTFIETPPLGAVLTPRILPSSGGDTLWGSNVAAYEALSAPIRKLLDGLTAEHSFETGFPRRRAGASDRERRNGRRPSQPIHPSSILSFGQSRTAAEGFSSTPALRPASWN
jgi:taurine dioxygenase